MDKLHDDPPTSTEQILHPARYFDTRDTPVAITLARHRELARDGWTPVLEDTLGEIFVRVIAERDARSASAPPRSRRAGAATACGRSPAATR